MWLCLPRTKSTLTLSELERKIFYILKIWEEEGKEKWARGREREKEIDR